MSSGYSGKQKAHSAQRIAQSLLLAAPLLSSRNGLIEF
jgi:hypothetical protein